jgi:sec-independent protein translocase protein TatA
MSLGPLEIGLIIVLVLLLFGAGRVPNIMENLAKGVKSFKQGLKDEPSPKKVEKKDD